MSRPADEDRVRSSGKGRGRREAAEPPAVALIDDVLAAISAGRPVREEFEDGGRLHVDRALPFLCVHFSAGRRQLAARDVASANASYLLAPDPQAALPLVQAVGDAMVKRFGAFLLLDVGELEHDRFLSEDAPFLPPFEVTLSATGGSASRVAAESFAASLQTVHTKFRTPRIIIRRAAEDPAAPLGALVDFPCVTVRFAPIYRVPESGDLYPELHQRVVANILDAGLQAVAAFVAATDVLVLPTHRALGRRVFVDAVSRADRAMDEVASSFDFLLAVTPINAGAAWQAFEASGFAQAPRFLYRPLTVRPDTQKRKLFTIAFDHFEDPLLIDLYREKQQELDLQLSLLLAREAPRFIEIGRALYGPVEPGLLAAAKALLADTQQLADTHRLGAPVAPADRLDSATGRSDPAGAVELASAVVTDGDAIVDSSDLAAEAWAMIEAYRREDPEFAVGVELRDDLPPGMMVVDGRLLIARGTRMARNRVEALLSHEVGVHLLTWSNGTAQGLRLFRSGLAGYEGMQEGLAVFSEYLVGGMTAARLRLIAARVVGCAAMLDGASFVETFRLLRREHGFAAFPAFNIALRLHRGGGLAKDAIYLRGLLEVLDHLGRGGVLDPFWMGKIAASHFGVIQELSLRGLLRAPRTKPAFLSHPQAAARLDSARAGLSPIDMISA